MIRVANAPVSFGVFDLAGRRAGQADAEALLEGLREGGYTGIDLGPVGFLGDAGDVRSRLDRVGMDLAGGWIDLRFSDDDGFVDDLPGLDAVLDVLIAGASADPAFAPRPTLACSGSPRREARPGGGATDPALRLADRDWSRFAGNVQRAVDRCRERGLEPTFHHHACTYVEAPVEIERLLESTDVGICLDTGHLLLGGGDPVTAVRDWGSRVNHLHVKDVRIDMLRQVVAEGAGMRTLWERGVFCALGEGDLDLLDLLSAVRESGYAGWLVVEQDVVPGPGDTFESLLSTQNANRETLRRWGW